MATQIDNVIQIKRGDWFIANGLVKDQVSGLGVDITGWTIASKIRDKTGALVSTCTVTVTNAAIGTYKLVVTNTTAWPVTPVNGGNTVENNDYLRFDVEFTTSTGQIISDATKYINVVEDITY